MDLRHRGRADRRSTTSGRSPGTRAVVEPSLREDVPSTSPRSPPPAAGSSARDGASAGHRAARWSASASTARRCRRARAGDSARRLAALVDIDAAPYVKRVEAAGDKAFVEAIVYRSEEVPRRRCAAYDDIPGALALPNELPLAPTQEFAAPILGTVGEVTAEMIEEDPDTYQAGDEAGLSGLQARYDDQLRGTDGAVVDAVGSDGKERELFRVDAARGRAARAHPRRAAAAGGRAAARGRRSGERAGRDPALDRRDPGRGQRPGQQRLQHGDLRPVRARLDVQERQQPGAAAGRADAGHRRAVHGDDHRRRQGVQELLRLPAAAGSAGSRCAPRWRTPATPPSSPRPAGSATETSPTRPPRSGWGSTTTSASRRTSAASSRPPRTPRRPRT